MPRTAAYAVENDFTKGILTEFTGLNFPEKSCIDALNVIFDNTGAVLRRTGHDLEDGYAYRTSAQTDASDVAYKTFYWNNVDTNNLTNFVVIQTGGYVYISKPNNGALSADAPLYTINLTTYKISGAPDPKVKYAGITQGSGYLFISHPFCQPLYVKYDSLTAVFTTVAIDIQIRDVRGLEETIANDFRPPAATTTKEHKYNVQNQSWDTAGSIGRLARFISSNYGKGRYPSNADVWWHMKNPENHYDPDDHGDDVLMGNSHAPKGYYISSPFFLDRAALARLPGLAVETSGYQRPSTVGFYQGRIWFAGVASTNYNNVIYFSQIVDSPDDFGKCYQRNDPTSENQNDILSNDGGTIKILEAGQVLYLLPVGNSMFAFCTNGIWQIQGSQGLGFTATDYSVSKVTDLGCKGTNSFVIAAGTPFWWNTDGIYTLVQTPSGEYQASSITEQSIKQLFQGFVDEAIDVVQGAFSITNKEILWVFPSNGAYKFLQYRLQNSAFSVWEVSAAKAIKSIIAYEGFAATASTEVVTTNNLVTVTGLTLSPVTVPSSIPYSISSTFKTLLINPGTTQYTFGDFSNADLKDWISIAEEDYDSYFETGYKIRGSGLKKFQLNYVAFFLDLSRYPTGTCYLTASWDWATRQTNSQNLYRTFPSDATTGRTRLVIRGNGEAATFRFESYSSDPFHVIGWSELATGNAQP